MIRKPPYVPRHVGPVGPSVPLAQVYNQEPFVYAPNYMARNMKHARGVNVFINSVPANTNITIQHNLGRYMKGAIAMQNNNGANYPPRVRLVIGQTRTLSQQTIQVEEAGNALIIWVY